MNAETKIKKGGVHAKLSLARQTFHALALKKSGRNSFAGYDYFELGDFLIPALKVFDEVGLGATVSFDRELATMTILDLENPSDTIVITSPMGSAALKGCHEVQNIGAVETYQRRYLWIAALEIVEHDALDATTGKAGAKADEITTGEPKPAKAKDAAPFTLGPAKNKTDLKAKGRDFWRDVEACDDEDSLVALIATHKPLIEQLKAELPTWWDGGQKESGEPFEGLSHVIDRNLYDFRNLNTRTPIDAG